MSINPNIHIPLNIDQEITRLNRIFQEFNAIDKKKKQNYSYGGRKVIIFIASVFAAMMFEYSQISLEEKKFRKNDEHDVPIIFCLFLFMAASGLLSLTLIRIDDRKLAEDPLVAKYLNDRDVKIPNYLNFSKDIKQNTLEYNYLNNFKMVINSETGKTLPYDVWNIISDYYFKKV